MSQKKKTKVISKLTFDALRLTNGCHYSRSGRQQKQGQKSAQSYKHKTNYQIRNYYTIHKLNKKLSAQPTEIV